jgi:hypothetical protein
MNQSKPIRSIIPRAIAFALGLVVVLYASYRVGQTYAEWRQPHGAPPVDAAAALSVNPLSSTLVEGGHWSFANLDWNIRSHVIPANRVDSKINSMIESLPIRDAALSAAPDASPELLNFIKSANLNCTVKDGSEIYRLERPTLKVVIVLRKIEDRTKAVGGMVAYVQNAQEWQAFDVFPRSSSTTRTDSAHLLPLPKGAIQNGVRTAADGTLLLEMIATKSSADSLLNEWKHAGWDVRPTTLGGSSNFSYLCARGNEMVYAFSADTGETLEHVILTRSPTDSELQSLTNTPTN